MLLRRVIEHVREQNWFAVGIDFMIVVVGVFIGIQVANWNEERLQAREGAQYAARLQTDLGAELENWQNLVAYIRVVRDNADRAVAILEGQTEASDEALLIHAYRATQYMYYQRRRATFDELTSTGSLGLIVDPALRDTAVLYFRFDAIDKAFDEGAGSVFRHLFRSVLPMGVQDALGQGCGDRIEYQGGLGQARIDLGYACETGLSAAQIAAAAQVLRTHPELLPALRLRAMNLRTSIGDLTDYAVDLDIALRAAAGAPGSGRDG
jgi:hypothetical protein